MSTSSAKKRAFSAPFVILLFYLFIEYGRPQSEITALATLRPGLISVGLLCITLLLNFKLLQFKIIQTKLFIILILLMTLHVPIARNNYWAYQMWYGMLTYFFVYLGITSFVNTYDKLENFITAWILINLVCAVIGIKNGGTIPGASFMKDENDFALVMNLAIPFAYFMFLGATSKKKRVFFVIATLLFVVASGSSLSRGGFIGLITVFFYGWYKTPNKIAGLILASLLVGILFFTVPDQYYDEIRSIREENINEGTGSIRWYYWQRGWLMFLANPIIGVGQGNFPWNIHDYEPLEGFHSRFHGGRAAHSFYVTLISELGLIGIFLFCGILFYSVKDLGFVTNLKENQLLQYSLKNSGADLVYYLNNMKYIAFGVLGGLLAFMVTGIFISVLYYPHFWIITALATTIGNMTKKTSLENYL